jgi:predicted RNase H-like nuclease (RuvC/YqgF family)
MSTKTTKTNKSKVATVGRGRAARPILPIEDDERHLAQADDYVSRNRDALNASIQRSRKEISEGKVSSKSVETIIAEGRRRHTRGS